MSEPRVLVSIRDCQGTFRAFADLDSVLADPCRDLEGKLHQAAQIYSRAVSDMREMVSQRESMRHERRPVPARLVWRIGRAVWLLRTALIEIGLELDGVYDHLCRDVGTKRKSLEKAVIFGRYIQHECDIPESLNWGKCEHGTRRIALQIGQTSTRST